MSRMREAAIADDPAVVDPMNGIPPIARPLPERERAPVDMRERVATAELKARVDELEGVVRALAATTISGIDDGEKTGRAQRDILWRCTKCSGLLAYYDKDTDTLRIRYKEHLVFACLGPGGWIQVICRQCGEPNEQRYQTTDQIADAQAHPPQVRARR